MAVAFFDHPFLKGHHAPQRFEADAPDLIIHGELPQDLAGVFVRNGPEPSVSLSITWRSEWSFAEADARAFNAVLRRIGMKPRQPARWPNRNTAKSLGWRVMRRLSLRG